jgi:hypothetical protein
LFAGWVEIGWHPRTVRHVSSSKAEAVRWECLREEGFTTEVAIDRASILRRREALVGSHARHIASRIREEEL